MNSYPTLRTGRTERRLWLELGDVPGALLMIILWTAVAVSALNLLMTYLPFLVSFFNEEDIHPPPPDMLSQVVLPLALITAVFHSLATSRRRLPLDLWTVIIAGAIAVAVGIALSAGEWLTLAHLPGLHLPEAIVHLKRIAWPALTLLATLSLAVSRRHRLSSFWAALLAGSVTGMGAILCLAYPLYTLTYTFFLAEAVYTGFAHYLVVFGAGLLGIGLIAVAGPLAVHWSRARGRGRLWAGALAGSVVGACLFGGLGGPLIGLIAQAPLYGVALDRTGYSVGEWTLKLALAVNNNFPLTYAVFWMLLGGGAIIGGLSADPTLLRRSPRPTGPIRAISRPILWPVVGLLSTMLLLVSVVNVAIVYLLGDVIQNILDMYGYTPLWPPSLIPLVAGGQPWLLYLALQAGALYWLDRHSSWAAAYPPVRWLTFGNGLLNVVVLPLLLYAMNRSYAFQLWTLAPMLVMMFLGVEMIAVSWRMRQHRAIYEAQRVSRRCAWATAGVVGGLLATLFIQQSVALALNLAYLAVASIEALLEETAPPPGLTWLDNLIAPLFALHLMAFVTTGLVLTLSGVIFSGALRLLHGRWRAWLSPNLGALGQGCLAWLLIVLTGSVAAVALAWWLNNDFTVSRFLFLMYVGLAGLFLALRHWRWSRVPLMLLLGLGIVALFVWAGDDVLLFLLTMGGPYLFLFVGGLLLSQSRIVAKIAGPRWAPPLRTMGWGLLAGAVVRLTAQPGLAPYVVGLALVVAVSHRSIVTYLAWPNLGLIFGLTMAGLIGLTREDPYQLLINDPRLWGSYLLLFGLAAGVSYRAINLYAPAPLRIVALPVAIGLIWLLAWLDHTPQILEGGVSHYDPTGQQWHHLTPANSALGGALAYHFFEDSQGRLWAGSGTGLVVRLTGQPQRAYLLFDASSLWDAWVGPRTGLMAEPLRLLEDVQGQMWAGTSFALGRFEPTRREDHLQLVAGKMTPDEESGAESFHTLNARLADVALDPAGRLWLATGGQGVLRLDTSGRHQPRWQTFTRENASLISNYVHTLAADPSGAIWAGTARGLARFNGTHWETVEVPPGLVDTPVDLLVADGHRQVWVGTSRGLFRWDGQRWTTFETNVGWPEECGATVLFEDSRGGMWAGTATDALRFDGQQWSYPVTNLHVTAFAEGPTGIIWVGGRQGVVRYNPATGEQTRFTAEEGSLAADWVRELYVDRSGKLWVSTFATRQVTRPRSWGIRALLLFFGALFVSVYLGYVQKNSFRSGSTKFHKWGKRV